MRYKVTAMVPGEPKSRQLFAPDAKGASDAVSIMLKTVPPGVEVKKWETEDKLIGVYTRKEEGKG